MKTSFCHVTLVHVKLTFAVNGAVGFGSHKSQ